MKTKMTLEQATKADVMIRYAGQGGSYGPAMELSDVPWIVREEILAALMDGNLEGRLNVGGQEYRWTAR